MKSGKKEE